MNLWLLIIIVAAGLLILAIVSVLIYLCSKQDMCHSNKKQSGEATEETELESNECSFDEQDTAERNNSDLEDQRHEGSAYSEQTGSSLPQEDKTSLSTLESGQLQRYSSMTSMSTITSERRKSLRLLESCGIIRFKAEFIQEQKELVVHVFYIYLGPIEPPSSSTLYNVSATLLPKKKQRYETKAQPFAAAAEDDYIVISFRRHMMIFKKIEDAKCLYRQSLRFRVSEHRVGSETSIAEALIHLADLVQTDPLFALDIWRPLYKVIPFQRTNVRNLVQHVAVLQKNLRKSASENIGEGSHDSAGSEIGEVNEAFEHERNSDPGVHSPEDEDVAMTTSHSIDDIQTSRAHLVAESDANR